MDKVDYKSKFLVACDPCRKSKTKCDRETICSSCIKKKVLCSYSKKLILCNELKRFYDSASSNIHMFKIKTQKKVKVEKNKKPYNIKFTLKTDSPDSPDSSKDPSPNSTRFSPLSSLADSSPVRSNYFPLLQIVDIVGPNMESMVHDLDKWIFNQATSKFNIGKSKLYNTYTINTCCEQNSCQDCKVILNGLDYIPTYLTRTKFDFEISRAQSLHLINVYFNQVNSFFPLISRNLFFKTLSNPNSYINPMLLNAIYFVASPYLASLPMYFNGCRFELSKHFHQKALALMDENIANPTIASLQAILLLYNGECSLVEKLNAIQYNMIQNLGLNDFNQLSLEGEKRSEALNLLRCCYMQDKICNLTRGRGFNLSKLRPYLDMDTYLNLTTIAPMESFPGSSFCQVCFLASVKICEIIESIHSGSAKFHNTSCELESFISRFEKQLELVCANVLKQFELSNKHLFSIYSLLLFHLFYHVAQIYLYLKAYLIAPAISKLIMPNLRKQMFLSACSITFLAESMKGDFFKFGPLLKMNSVILSFAVHSTFAKFTKIEDSELGHFGSERSCITNIRSVNFYFGILIDHQRSKELMDLFAAPIPILE
ncbi:hypothetical protein K502DRAFT_212586 [Neoconidiobolus thromboides FSU 785]|nr:hypothetical protein K502DRAFT_212586 [Neoconidiobolus thromboides FSU 785]